MIEPIHIGRGEAVSQQSQTSIAVILAFSKTKSFSQLVDDGIALLEHVIQVLMVCRSLDAVDRSFLRL